MQLQGLVDSFDGTTLGGWAYDEASLERTVEIQVFLDDQLVATIPCDQPRIAPVGKLPGDARKGFAHCVSPEGITGPPDVSYLPKITVKFAGTDRALSVVPALLGVINEDIQDTGKSIYVRQNDRFRPTPPARLIAHVAGEGTTPLAYRQVGMQILLDLVHHGLIPAGNDGTVVDLGCGCGRIATPLATILSENTRFFGFDTWRDGIRWAQKNISSVYPNFQFMQLGKRPRWWQPSGYAGEASYRLPLGDATCDLAIASSLFTHLNFQAASAYFAEFRRILKPEGRAYVTFFIYDERSQHRLTGYKVREDEHGVYFDHPSYFDTYIRYQSVERMLRGAGLRVVSRRNGLWRGEEFRKRWHHGYQDVLILQPES